jgi:hypothetical protein
MSTHLGSTSGLTHFGDREDCGQCPPLKPKPKPLPDIDPADALFTIVAKASTALAALAAENEGDLRTAVQGLHEQTTALLDLVTRW